MTFDTASKIVDLLVKAEVHAFALVGVGVTLVLHGQATAGLPILGAGLGVFKGNR